MKFAPSVLAEALLASQVVSRLYTRQARTVFLINVLRRCWMLMELTEILTGLRERIGIASKTGDLELTPIR